MADYRRPSDRMDEYRMDEYRRDGPGPQFREMAEYRRPSDRMDDYRMDGYRRDGPGPQFREYVPPPDYMRQSGHINPPFGKQPDIALQPQQPQQPHFGYNQQHQTPVVQQPTSNQNTTVLYTGVMGQGPVRPMRNWSTEICDCFQDPKICLLVALCPDCYGSHLATKAGETRCLPCCVPGWMISLRAHIRGKHNITGSICDDCCMVTFCYPCAMCQLSREIDNINKGAAPQ